jgi:hypothetical protein
MKIISDFHDFYDPVRQMDTDKNNIYVRKTSEIIVNASSFKVEDENFYKLNRQYHLRDSVKIKMFHLGFCNNIYTGIKVDKNICGDTSVSIHYGDFDQIKKLFDEIGKPFSYRPRKYKMMDYRTKRLTEAFESSNMNKLKELFLKHKVPVFVALSNYNEKYCYQTDKKIILNPRLQDWEFFKIKDIYTAYQDISMYIGNNLVDDRNNAWPIEDKLKVQAHGFDKYSFRKEKQT